jgi:hypothetical protein
MSNGKTKEDIKQTIKKLANYEASELVIKQFKMLERPTSTRDINVVDKYSKKMPLDIITKYNILY